MRRSVVLTIVVAVILAAVLGAVPAGAQGNSPLRVTAIRVSPEPFRVGADVSVTATIKNPTATASGPGTAYLSISKADTALAADVVFHTQQNFPAIPAGRSHTVTFTTHWTVAGGNDRYYLGVTAIDPPNEFGEEKKAVFIATCQYVRQAQLVVAPQRSLQDLQHPK